MSTYPGSYRAEDLPLAAYARMPLINSLKAEVASSDTPAPLPDGYKQIPLNGSMAG